VYHLTVEQYIFSARSFRIPLGIILYREFTYRKNLPTNYIYIIIIIVVQSAKRKTVFKHSCGRRTQLLPARGVTLGRVYSCWRAPAREQDSTTTLCVRWRRRRRRRRSAYSDRTKFAHCSAADEVITMLVFKSRNKYFGYIILLRFRLRYGKR